MSLPEAVFAGNPSGVAGFIAAFGSLGGHVHRAPTPADVPTAVAVAVDGRAPVVVGIDGVDGDLRWPECGIEGAAGAAVAVVGAVAGIAATGSLALDAGVARGRAVSLLAPVCVFVVDADTIVDRPSQLLRTWRDRWPDGPPSQLVLVSGPSRSADIEMSLTVGVHGPGEVHAVIVGGEL